jgi:hypothetical protein
LDNSLECYEATLVLKDHGRDTDVIFLTDPNPAWPDLDEMGEGENPVLNLNSSDSAEWAHTKDKLAAKLVEAAAAAAAAQSRKRKSDAGGGAKKKATKKKKKKKK